MIIGIDGNEANVAHRVGISEYSFELLKQFGGFRISNLPTDREDFEFRIYLKNKPLAHMPKMNNYWKYKIIGPTPLWTQIALPLDLYLRNPRPDVVFTPTHYAPRFSPIPIVISIMDLSYIYYPELFKKSDLFQLKNWTAYSVKKAKKILTISNASKNDIIKTYGIASDKVIVTYPGVSSSKSESFSNGMNKLSIEGKYILFVGTLQPRKNIERLVEAFSIIAQKQKDLRLVIVGKKGWLYDSILAAPKAFGIEDRVLFLDFVRNEELIWLYQHAVCFVLPSLYEGFGLPVLEAMKYGCPVITSNVSSLPEAGGDAALYVNPENTQDIKEKILLFLENDKLRNEHIEKGYQQVKKFSWKKTAQKTLEVLQEVALKNKNS